MWGLSAPGEGGWSDSGVQAVLPSGATAQGRTKTPLFLQLPETGEGQAGGKGRATPGTDLLCRVRAWVATGTRDRWSVGQVWRELTEVFPLGALGFPYTHSSVSRCQSFL